MCADIDRTVGLANIELRDVGRNALGLTYNIITIKELEEWFCNVILILVSPFLNNTVIEAISNLSGNSFSSFDLSHHEASAEPNLTRKNAVVEYLDYQIPVTQLNGDMQAAKRD